MVRKDSMGCSGSEVERLLEQPMLDCLGCGQKGRELRPSAMILQSSSAGHE